MKIGLLIIATEVLEGKITDLNTRFLALFLKKHHLELFSALTVRDDQAEIKKALVLLLDSCDFVITSGGLGPTKDDLTKEVLGQYLNQTSVYSEVAHQVAEENYKKYDRPYPGKDHVYSFLPKGVTPLSNSTGLAPGLFTQIHDKSILCVPGVPREFKSMLEDHISPWLNKNHKSQILFENMVFRTKRVPEEKIFGELDPELWNELTKFGEVSSLPGMMGVDIGIKLRARDDKELAIKKAHLLTVMENSPIKPHIWHQGEERLEEVIVKLANQKKITFGFAESCTGGLCSHRITNISGSSHSFLGSVISYDNSVKMKSLEVSAELISIKGVISAEVAEAMAKGLVAKLDTDIGVSITGIAGPHGGTPELPVGTVCIAAHFKNGKTNSYKHRFFGDRETLKERFAQAALILLHEALEEIAGS
jgi:nicotinamide-nucleotide amidase